MTDKLCIFRLGNLADIFSKMNQGSFLFQWKQQTVIYCQRSNLSFRAKIRILETYICHSELDSSPEYKDFSNEIDGDINECGFFNRIIIMSTFGSSAQCGKAIFSN